LHIVFYNIHCNFTRHNWCFLLNAITLTLLLPKKNQTSRKNLATNKTKQLYDRWGCQEDRTSRLP